MRVGTQRLEGKLILGEGERAGHGILRVVELKQHAGYMGHGGGLVDVLGLDELRLLVHRRPQPVFFVRVALVELRRLLVAAGLRVADGIDEPKVIAWDGLLQRRLRLQRLLEMFLELGAVAAGNDGVLVGSSPLANGRLVEGGVDARAGHGEG
ncbi:hypothetical protein BD626DRAFT_520964 [Schizophyllum amplum]|uniref:Uncharacterized protein n=1 Tax=Schizophyllum amplum TaxID=97359 RepID=A0A550BU72_9AGAR|nr:hypothetical protein BD626DRAFT_520964 [Auriculariopsis ampla]